MINRKEKLLEMLMQSPEDVFLNYGIALEFKSEGDLNQALTFFEKCLKIQENHTPSMYQLALVYEEIGEIDKMMEILDRGIEILKASKDLKSLNEFRSLKAMNSDF